MRWVIQLEAIAPSRLASRTTNKTSHVCYHRFLAVATALRAA
jgi:hypothetical protein